MIQQDPSKRLKIEAVIYEVEKGVDDLLKPSIVLPNGQISVNEKAFLSELRLVVQEHTRGIAFQVRNDGLTRAGTYDVDLRRLDLYSERHDDFTSNPFEPLSLLNSGGLNGLDSSRQHVFALASGAELQIRALTPHAMPVRRDLVVRVGGKYRCALDVRIGKERVLSEDVFIEWQPHRIPTLVRDPRNSEREPLRPIPSQRPSESVTYAMNELQKRGYKYYRRIEMSSVTGIQCDNNRLTAAIRPAAFHVSGWWWPYGVRVGGMAIEKGFRWVGYGGAIPHFEFIEATADGRIVVIDTQPTHVDDELPYDQAIVTTFNALHFWHRTYGALLSSGNEIKLSMSWGGLKGKVLSVSDAVGEPWALGRGIVRNLEKRAFIDGEFSTGEIRASIAEGPRRLVEHAAELMGYFFGMFDFPVKAEAYPQLYEIWKSSLD